MAPGGGGGGEMVLERLDFLLGLVRGWEGSDGTRGREGWGAGIVLFARRSADMVCRIFSSFSRKAVGI